MACTINFTIGKNEFPVIENIDKKLLYGEGNNLSPKELFDNIVKVLKQTRIKNADNKNTTAYSELIRSISKDLQDNLVDFAVEKLEGFNESSLVPNVNLEYIKDLYPNTEFSDKFNDTQILLIDYLDPNSTQPVIGRVIDENGKELIILKNNKISVMRLQKHLKLKESLQDPNFLKNIEESNPKLIEDLKEVANHFGQPSIEDLVLQFEVNNSEFYESDFKTKSGESPVPLIKAVQDISDGYDTFKYESNFLNELKSRLIYFKNGAYLNIDAFFSSILNYGDWGILMQKIGITNGKQFIDFFSKDSQSIIEALDNKKLNSLIPSSEETKEGTVQDVDVINFIQNYKNISADGLEGVFRLFGSFKQIYEPMFQYIPISTEKKKGSNSITFTKEGATFENLGVGYDTIKNFVEVSHAGPYRVYQRTEEDGTKYYYVSHHIIGVKSYGNPILTLEEAKAKAEELMQDLTLDQGSLMDLKENVNDVDLEDGGRSFESDVKIAEGTIVSSLPYNISKKGMLGKEAILFKRNLKEFQDYLFELFGEAEVQRDTVMELLDSPEKAAIFLSELNATNENGNPKYDRSNYPQLQQLAEQIAASNPNYYMIRKVKYYGGVYRHYFIPINPKNNIENVRQQPRIPTIQLLESIAEVLKGKFGVPIKIINGTELNDLQQDSSKELYNLDINQNAKAFIVNGTIYINSDVANANDLFHEYGHLFLGVLKMNNLKTYKDMLDYLTQFKEVQDELTNKQKFYPNRSYYDLLEEVFADLYGQWLENNLPKNLNNIFEYIGNSDKVKEMQYSVFDKTADGSKKGMQYIFGGKYLSTVWSRFNRDVQNMLSSTEDFSFLRDDALKIQRQQANWIENQISLFKQQKAQNKNKKDSELDGIKEVCV